MTPSSVDTCASERPLAEHPCRLPSGPRGDVVLGSRRIPLTRTDCQRRIKQERSPAEWTEELLHGVLIGHSAECFDATDFNPWLSDLLNSKEEEFSSSLQGCEEEKATLIASESDMLHSPLHCTPQQQQQQPHQQQQQSNMTNGHGAHHPHPADSPMGASALVNLAHTSTAFHSGGGEYVPSYGVSSPTNVLLPGGVGGCNSPGANHLVGPGPVYSGSHSGSHLLANATTRSAPMAQAMGAATYPATIQSGPPAQFMTSMYKTPYASPLNPTPLSAPQQPMHPTMSPYLQPTQHTLQAPRKDIAFPASLSVQGNHGSYTTTVSTRGVHWNSPPALTSPISPSDGGQQENPLEFPSIPTGASSSGSYGDEKPTPSADHLRAFAKQLKLKRIRKGFTQHEVGRDLGLMYHQNFSQTTICRFEAQQLSHKNMCKLYAILKRWSEDVDSNTKQTLPPNSKITGKQRKKRTSIAPEARRHLEQFFQKNKKPTAPEITEYARAVSHDKEVVRVWFCNRRQKDKRSGGVIPAAVHYGSSNGSA